MDNLKDKIECISYTANGELTITAHEDVIENLSWIKLVGSFGGSTQIVHFKPHFVRLIKNVLCKN